MDVPSLANEHESDAHSIDQSSDDGQEISDVMIDSDHQEASGAIEGKTKTEANHLPLLGDGKFRGKGVGDEEGDTLNGEVHWTQCLISGGFPDLGDDGHEGAEAYCK